MFRRQRARERIAKERLLYQRRPGGELSVCVVYPNVYRLAMANLGFQAIFQIFDMHRLVDADRAFLPDPDELAAMRVGGRRLVSFEQGRPLSDYDILAFSIAFETDYLNLLAILDLAGLPARRRSRADRAFPLVICGGSAVFLNPEPIADFVDLFLIGEGEEMVPEFLERCAAAHKLDTSGRLDAVSGIGGAYRPEWFTPVYGEAGRLTEFVPSGQSNPRVERRAVRDLDRFPAASRILTEESVFGDMYLVEASRGCQWGCRFCAAGFMYRPIRYRTPEGMAEEARRGLAKRQIIGLVGAEMASVPGVAGLAAEVAARGGRLSPSSLKADCITPALVAALSKGESHSVTIAPEAGSERMRKVINKNLSEPQILAAAEMLVGQGVENLKLYFMVGLPEEQAEDVLAIAELTRKILACTRGTGRPVGRVTVSLNPFVPKPWTPFQWDPMEPPQSLRRKIALLHSALGRLDGVQLDAESPREAYFQALVSRGDRRVGAILERLCAAKCQSPGDVWSELRRIRRETRGTVDSALVDPDAYVIRAFGHNELLAWDFIDHHVHKWFLLSERKKAHFEHQTKPCDVTRCRVCGAC